MADKTAKEIRCTLKTAYRKKFFLKYKRKTSEEVIEKMTMRVAVFKSCELNKKPKPNTCDATRVKNWLSEEERRVDALALRADERRDKLRKASGRSKYPSIRRYLNGETQLRSPQLSIRQSITYGREPGELKQSEEERRVDALALRADERRDKLRKASGRSKYPSIRRYLNGETQLRSPQLSIRQSITYGREPGELKHLSSRRKRKKHRFLE